MIGRLLSWLRAIRRQRIEQRSASEHVLVEARTELADSRARRRELDKRLDVRHRRPAHRGR